MNTTKTSMKSLSKNLREFLAGLGPLGIVGLFGVLFLLALYFIPELGRFLQNVGADK